MVHLGKTLPVLESTAWAISLPSFLNGPSPLGSARLDGNRIQASCLALALLDVDVLDVDVSIIVPLQPLDKSF